jgi:pimeloyl-ACP methyl ester carboxylesterase
MPAVPGVQHRHVQAGEVRLHVAEAGEGEPVMLLHGWPQHWYMWRHVIPPLAERYRVICPDLRGLGWSEAPRGGYEKETMASDVLALMDELGLERVRLVGHDWGGLAGFFMCLRAPERFERYLVLDTAHPWIPFGAKQALGTWRLWYQAVLSTPLLGALATRPIVQASYRVGVNQERVSAAEWATFADQFREPERAHASVQIYRSFLLRDLPAILRGRYRGKRLTVPTVFLLGKGDPVITPDMLESARPHVDDLEIEVVPGVGHFIADEAGELVAERALSFFGAA